MEMDIKHRRDIDGLRCLAVLPVVGFHLDWNLFSGGYVGVDIFFVISGYLISLILLREVESNRLSIVSFYERRVRRILPALFCMIFVATAVAVAIFLPADLGGHAQAVSATTLFGSNILFWLQAGYFDARAEMKPLLHTWSLSVEEQFYIFFPLVLAAAWRLGGRRLTVISMLALTAISFSLSVWAVDELPTATFYLLPTRAWELMLGSLLALGVVPAVRSRSVCELAGVAGLLCIGYAVFTYQRDTQFPGLNAVAPCLGAALIIHAGSGGLSGTVARMLSARPLVFIGLISYSLYLWHWPLIVFAKYLSIDPLTDVQRVLTFGISLVLATLSWRYVEQPFRRNTHRWRRPVLFGTAATAMCSALVIGIAVSRFDGLPGRLPQSVLSVADMKRYLDPRFECNGAYVQRMTAQSLCVRGAVAAQPTFLLVGDSHAGAMAGGVFEAANRAGIAGLQLSDSSYRPVIGLLMHREEKRYTWMNAQLTAVLTQNPQLATVVVVIFWNQAVNVDEYEESNGRRIKGQEAMREGLLRLVRSYPNRRFIFLTSPAMSSTFGVSAAARAMLFGRQYAPVVPLESFRTMEASYRQILDELDALPSVQVLDISSHFCHNGLCSGLIHGELAYLDNNHLSYIASRELVPDLKQALEHAERDEGKLAAVERR